MNKPLRSALKSRKFAATRLAIAKREARKIVDEARKEIIAADKALGAVLRGIRKARHLKLTTLQEKSGLLQGNLSGMETGKTRITDRSLNLILEALEIV